ncbi:MAG: DUF4830 domain-containing protein [Oscillospiraceae bacterium]|nr:DUF4830 domain-containing protein [Oscillospiraceae bacterium]
MFVWSLKMSRRFWVILGAAVLCAAGAMFLLGRAPSRPASAGEGKLSQESFPGKTEQERRSFLEGFGWELEQEPYEIVEMVIPEEFDAAMERYNGIQKAQAMDLSPFCGRRCRRYTYVVTNYPGRADPVQANLLVLDGKIIGGDITLLGEGESIQGFTAPKL